MTKQIKGVTYELRHVPRESIRNDDPCYPCAALWDDKLCDSLCQYCDLNLSKVFIVRGE